MLDTHGVQTNSFRCADCMQIELEFHLDEPVDRPLIPTRCATSTAKSYSGPTRSSWALRFQGLPLGVTSIASHCSKWFVGIPSTFSTDTRRPSPTKCTSDETAGLCDLRAALNAAVSSVTPSPTAPYVLTLATCPCLSGIALPMGAPVPVKRAMGLLVLPVREFNASAPAASFPVCPLIAGASGSRPS